MTLSAENGQFKTSGTHLGQLEKGCGCFWAANISCIHTVE